MLDVHYPPSPPNATNNASQSDSCAAATHFWTTIQTLYKHVCMWTFHLEHFHTCMIYTLISTFRYAVENLWEKWTFEKLHEHDRVPAVYVHIINVSLMIMFLSFLCVHGAHALCNCACVCYDIECDILFIKLNSI